MTLLLDIPLKKGGCLEIMLPMDTKYEVEMTVKWEKIVDNENWQIWVSAASDYMITKHFSRSEFTVINQFGNNGELVNCSFQCPSLEAAMWFVEGLLIGIRKTH
jgi:hypothetical protein